MYTRVFRFHHKAQTFRKTALRMENTKQMLESQYFIKIELNNGFDCGVTRSVNLKVIVN